MRLSSTRPAASLRCEYLLIGLTGALLLGKPARTGAQSVAPTVPAPAWAYPLASAPPARPDSLTPRHVPGSQMAFTAARTLDRFDVADWFPESHPPMPPSVSHGRRPSAFACGFCHLPDGGGRPENAALAGLSAEYIVQQVRAMRDGGRDLPWPGKTRPMDAMRLVAVSATDAEIDEAARYFASLQPRRRSRVVETSRVPRMRVGASGLYFLATEGGDELLGDRLLEAPVSTERHELHDPSVEYVAYVPLGSIARGGVIATQGIPPVTAPCVSCHGVGLRGTSLAPLIAGRSASYLLRQLIAFSVGSRADSASAPMRAVARTLALGDMTALAAYVASLNPD